MDIETLGIVLSSGISVCNTLAVVGLYLQHIQRNRNVFCTIRVDSTGDVEIYDPLKLIQ